MRISDWSSDVCSSICRSKTGEAGRYLEFRRPTPTSPSMQGDEDILTVALDAGAVGLRLDRALAEALPNLSRERVKTLIKGGRVADDSGTVLWEHAAKAAAPATLRLDRKSTRMNTRH